MRFSFFRGKRVTIIHQDMRRSRMFIMGSGLRFGDFVHCLIAFRIIVNSHCIDIFHFLIETFFRAAYFTDTFKQLIKIIPSARFFKPCIIQYEAFNLDFINDRCQALQCLTPIIKTQQRKARSLRLRVNS